MSGAVAQAPGKTEGPASLSMNRHVLSCWYQVTGISDPLGGYPMLTSGPTATHGTCPPPNCVSLSSDSSKVIINSPPPAVLKSGLASSGALLACSQASAIASGP